MLVFGLIGMISGLSIANVVIIGIFIIPMMKRIGFLVEKVDVVEVVFLVNG